MHVSIFVVLAFAILSFADFEYIITSLSASRSAADFACNPGSAVAAAIEIAMVIKETNIRLPKKIII